MATTKRRTVREWMRTLFCPQRPAPPQTPQVSSAPAVPSLPVTVVKAILPPPVSSNSATAPKASQTHSLPTVLGSDCETGEAVSLSLEERFQGLYVIGATGTGKTTVILNMGI